jgi:DNA topoisomerase-2
LYNQIDDDTLEITELPVGTWTQNYKEFLETLISGNEEKKKSPIVKVIKWISLILIHYIYLGLQRIPHGL